MNLTPDLILANRHLAGEDAAVIDEMAEEWQRLKGLLETEGVMALLSEVTVMGPDDAKALLVHGLFLAVSAAWPDQAA